MKIKKKAPTQVPSRVPAPLAPLAIAQEQPAPLDPSPNPDAAPEGDGARDTGALPHAVWRNWSRARDAGDWLFVFDMTHPDGPARAAMGPRGEFDTVCRTRARPIPGLPPSDLMRIRRDGDEIAHLIQARGHSDRSRSTWIAERMLLLRTESRWEIWSVHAIERPRGASPKALAVADFPPADLPEPWLSRQSEAAGRWRKVREERKSGPAVERGPGSAPTAADSGSDRAAQSALPESGAQSAGGPHAAPEPRPE